MCKRKIAGDCVAEVANRLLKVLTKTSVDSFNWKVDSLFCENCARRQEASWKKISIQCNLLILQGSYLEVLQQPL